MRIEKDTYNTTNREKSDYSNKHKSANKKQNFMMFLSIFFVLLLVFLGFARMLSPDVDITLGDDSENYQESESINEVDSRLKALQAEDEDGYIEDENVIEEDGLVLIPKKQDSEQNSDVQEELALSEKNEPAEAPARENITEVPSPVTAPVAEAPVTTAKTYRVYVGMYSSQTQAEVARGILQDAGLGVTPAIKQVGGGYTLQVGAFSSKESANNLSNKLLMNNYPSRVVSD